MRGLLRLELANEYYSPIISLADAGNAFIISAAFGKYIHAYKAATQLISSSASELIRNVYY